MRKTDEPDPDLDRVISAVLAGDAVDWTAETSERRDLKPLFEELRVLESVSAIHRVALETPDPDLEQWGPLRVIERIGRGGFGDVYRAFDPRLEREVALKLIRPNSGRESRILQEARRMARVRHTNVVVVHGADDHKGRAGMWTDLIEGKTLEGLISEGGPLGAEEATSIGLDLCRALAAVHAAGIAHRDVKTTNVMRERGGRTVLMDFGAGVDLVPAGDVGIPEDGTPLTLAPEELRGEPATQVSDLYSLGVLLYRLVTGRFPYEAGSYDALRTLHDRGQLMRLRDRRPDLPASFVTVVEHALETAAERRFQSAGEFERALLDTRRTQRHGSPSRPLTLWLTAGVAVSVIAATVLWNQGARRAVPKEPAPVPEAIPACLSAWWRGEGNVNEQNASWSPGAVHGAEFSHGRFGTGFHFDGRDDWVDLGNGPGDFGPGDFTLDLWVRFIDLAGEQVLAEDYIEDFTPTAPGWSLTKLVDNRIVFGFDNTILASVPKGLIEAKRWHHVAVTREGSAIAIYLDGVQRGSGSSVRNFQSRSTLRLGHRGGPSDTPGSVDTRGFYLRGGIDEVAVYHCALTFSQIASLAARNGPR